MATTLTAIVLPSAEARLAALRARMTDLEPPIIVIGPTRSAADEFALGLALDRGATFGMTRVSVAELVARTALPVLARQGLTPTAPLSDEAVAARVADALLKQDDLDYFSPVADMPTPAEQRGRLAAARRSR